MKYITFVIKFY